MPAVLAAALHCAGPRSPDGQPAGAPSANGRRPPTIEAVRLSALDQSPIPEGSTGADALPTFALQRDRRQASPDDFPQQLAELLAYFEDALPQDHPFARLAGMLPGRPELPAPWLLGSSPQSALWAGELGLPYAFADFI